MQAQLILTLALGALAMPALAVDVTYRNDIRSLIKTQCAECHGDTAPTLAEFKLAEERYKKEKVGPRSDTYADLVQLVSWPDTGALMRRLDDGSNTPDKKPGNMYKYLGETDAERTKNLVLMKTWVGGAGTWNLNRWQKRGDVPAITKEQLDLLQLKY